MISLLAAALLVVSVDGLDQRYLDNPSLKIPHLRRVIGIVPTVTWPSHTTILTGADAWDHGGDYYWSVSLLKRPTLLDAAAKAALKTATFCQDIAARFQSFRKEWMDDRTRLLATRYLLQKADAVFVHLLDLDSEAHAIGEMLAALPKGGRFVLVSDHGFETAVKSVNLKFAAERDKIGGIEIRGGFVIASGPPAAAWLRQLSPEHAIGREIPADEIARFAPPLTGKFLFEPAPGVWFGPGNDVLIAKPHETGNHGHWPTRYRSVYAAWGPGIRPARLPEMRITEIADRLASLAIATVFMETTQNRVIL